jgi:hypothetical protein
MAQWIIWLEEQKDHGITFRYSYDIAAAKESCWWLLLCFNSVTGLSEKNKRKLWTQT